MSPLSSTLGYAFSPKILGQAYTATQECIAHSAKYGFEHRDICAKITQDALGSYQFNTILQATPSIVCTFIGSAKLGQALANTTWSATLSDAAQGIFLIGLGTLALYSSTENNFSL